MRALIYLNVEFLCIFFHGWTAFRVLYFFFLDCLYITLELELIFDTLMFCCNRRIVTCDLSEL